MQKGKENERIDAAQAEKAFFTRLNGLLGIKE